MNTNMQRLWRTRFLVVPLLLMLLLLPTVVQAAESTHTVRPGESLNQIAERYGITVADLVTANTIANPNWIYPGQVLVIPDGSGDLTQTPDDNSTDDSGDESAPPEVDYVVRAGDTLYKIATRNGVSVAELREANDLYHTNLIYPGQRLTIPGADEASSSDASSDGATNTAPVGDWTTGDVAVGEAPVGEAPVSEAPVAEVPAGNAETAPRDAPRKQIVVDKSDQRAYVYENGQMRWTFIVSTGMPGSETWEGTFHIRSKIPNAYAYLWGLQMPYWLGFYHTGYLENGFHALPIMSNGAILWDGYLGTPVSYGCVILSYTDAQTLYQWAEIGTEVVVRP